MTFSSKNTYVKYFGISVIFQLWRQFPNNLWILIGNMMISFLCACRTQVIFLLFPKCSVEDGGKGGVDGGIQSYVGFNVCSQV